MAIIDSRLQLSALQTLSASGALTDYLDLSSDRDVGPGQPMWFEVVLGSAPASNDGDETYTMSLETASAASFSAVTQLLSFTIPRTAAAGTKYTFGMPMQNLQYVRAYATLGGTTPSLSIATAYLTSQEPRAWQAYPNSPNI